LVAQQKELETEKRRQNKLKQQRQAQIQSLRKELKEKGMNYNLDDWIIREKSSTNSTSTATGKIKDNHEWVSNEVAAVSTQSVLLLAI